MTTENSIAIGKPIRRVDGPEKVTGDAAYAADIKHANSVWAKTLRSP